MNYSHILLKFNIFVEFGNDSHYEALTALLFMLTVFFIELSWLILIIFRTFGNHQRLKKSADIQHEVYDDNFTSQHTADHFSE